MLDARSLGRFRCGCVSQRNLRAAVDEKEHVDIFESCSQGFRVGEIAKTYIDAIVEAGLCLVCIADEDPRTEAALNEKVDYFGSDVSCCTCNEIGHLISSDVNWHE